MDTEKPYHAPLAGERLDHYLARVFPLRSRREWKEVLRDRRVRSGRQVLKASDPAEGLPAALECRAPDGSWEPLELAAGGGTPGVGQDIVVPETARAPGPLSGLDLVAPWTPWEAGSFWARRLAGLGVVAFPGAGAGPGGDTGWGGDQGDRGETALADRVVLPAGLAASLACLGAPVYRDAWLVAFNKPAGLPSHPLSLEEPGPSLADLAVLAFPACALAGDTPREAGLVHRLDTDTSGLIVCALDPAAWHQAVALFRRSGPEAADSGPVTKTYLAVVAGDPGEPGTRRVLEYPVAHGADRSGRMVGVGAAFGAGPWRGQPRPARSGLQVLARVRLAGGGVLGLVAVELSHGQRHQVRVHCAALGCSLWGDRLYGGPEACQPVSLAGQVWEPAGHALHAWRLALPHPVCPERRLELEAPLPPGLAALAMALGWTGGT